MELYSNLRGRINMFRKVKSFLYNLWLFRKCLCEYRAWDYTGMLSFMETCARDMSKLHKESGNTVRADDTAKELLVFAEHLNRIAEDNVYLDSLDFSRTDGKMMFKLENKPNTLPIYGTMGWRRLESGVTENHLEQASRMFKRKVRTWWD